MDLGIKVVVVYGGVSTERDVSLDSGEAVANALIEYGYTNVTLFDLTQNNIGELIAMNPDIAFLALHGKGGEDGCIQGALELAGIPYTGPSVLASAVCMNKVFTKRVLKSVGIPTADYLEFDKRSTMSKEEISKKIIDQLGLPVVLKSPCQGSSISVVSAHSEEEIKNAIDEVFNYGDELLVEEFLNGVEITLPIIGNENPEVLPEIEIALERELLDYDSKRIFGLCHHIIPARISEEDREKVYAIGKQAYKALHCCGISRIDFIIDKNKGPMVVEVNTLPGMTDTSFAPKSGRAAGLSFGELVSKILQFGLEAKRDLL